MLIRLHIKKGELILVRLVVYRNDRTSHPRPVGENAKRDRAGSLQCVFDVLVSRDRLDRRPISSTTASMKARCKAFLKSGKSASCAKSSVTSTELPCLLIELSLSWMARGIASYSLDKASTGSSLAALRAGRKPKVRPIRKATTQDPSAACMEMIIGISPC